MTLIEAVDKVLDLYTCGMLLPRLGNAEAIEAMAALREAKDDQSRTEAEEWHRGERQWERV